MRRRDGLPIWVPHAGPGSQTLTRVHLGSKSADNQYDEMWVQSLLHNHPEVFPIDQIEPGFGTLIAVCRELPLQTGFLDNLFVTREGRLVIVETKLWRNPDARRSAVAQVMDYAAAVFRMSYRDLENAVAKARAALKQPPQSLFQIATGAPDDGDEAAFVDAVSWNLRQGRAVLAVVGDGIREDAILLAQLLQGHAGHRFTFSLVELAVYECPGNGRVIIPSVLVQTALIERGVVRLEGRGLTVENAPPDAASLQSAKPMGISEDEFYEALGQKDPGLPEALRTFLAKAEALGVYPDFLGGLNLKHVAREGNPLNMGTISKGGVVDTGPASWFPRNEAGHRYSSHVAELIAGVVKESANGEFGVRTSQGKMPRLSALLPQHETAWLNAIEQYIREHYAQSHEEADQLAAAHARVWGGTADEIQLLKPAMPYQPRVK